MNCTSLKLAQAGLWMVLFSSSVSSMICPDGSTPGSDALPSRICEGLLLLSIAYSYFSNAMITSAGLRQLSWMRL